MVKMSANRYLDYYAHQAGHGSSFYNGYRHMRGGGFWSRAFSSTILPALKFLGRAAAGVGGNVLTDIAQGDDPMDSVKTRLKEEGKNLMTKAADRARVYAQTGKGKKKVLKTKSKPKANQKKRENKRMIIPSYLR
jgi:uncharacterized membrane protein